MVSLGILAAVVVGHLEEVPCCHVLVKPPFRPTKRFVVALVVGGTMECLLRANTQSMAAE